MAEKTNSTVAAGREDDSDGEGFEVASSKKGRYKGVLKASYLWLLAPLRKSTNAPKHIRRGRTPGRAKKIAAVDEP
jgi:hypothetical protein